MKSLSEKLRQKSEEVNELTERFESERSKVENVDFTTKITRLLMLSRIVVIRSLNPSIILRKSCFVLVCTYVCSFGEPLLSRYT